MFNCVIKIVWLYLNENEDSYKSIYKVKLGTCRKDDKGSEGYFNTPLSWKWRRISWAVVISYSHFEQFWPLGTYLNVIGVVVVHVYPISQRIAECRLQIFWHLLWFSEQAKWKLNQLFWVAFFSAAPSTRHRISVTHVAWTHRLCQK
jgi:hypothetical protein